jgi:hypothetical protein
MYPDPHFDPDQKVFFTLFHVTNINIWEKIQALDLISDPHPHFCPTPDPDPHKMDADPKPCSISPDLMGAPSDGTTLEKRNALVLVEGQPGDLSLSVSGGAAGGDGLASLYVVAAERGGASAAALGKLAPHCVQAGDDINSPLKNLLDLFRRKNLQFFCSKLFLYKSCLYLILGDFYRLLVINSDVVPLA